MPIFSSLRFAIVPAIALAFSVAMHGQSLQGNQSTPGKIVGTVTDENGDPVPNATVVLKTSESNERRTLVTPESGFFEFTEVKPATPYEINVRAKDFVDWISPTVTIDPGQFKIVTASSSGLKLSEQRWTFITILWKLQLSSLRPKNSSGFSDLFPTFMLPTIVMRRHSRRR